MMQILSLQRILISLGVIVFAGALVAGATGAFFSDTETSTGNTFAAGNIDLQIDNESYVTSTTTGALIASPGTSWNLKDLVPGVDHFFNFSDLKPGDIGEDTISIHVGSNNAWMCAAARITADNDVSYTEPELADDLTVATSSPSTTDGELDEGVNFVFWHDDGDNVLEDNEINSIFLRGSLRDIATTTNITLADASSTITGTGGPIPGNTTFYVGKAWCFGALGLAPVTQDGQGKTGQNGPLVRGTGVSCDGSSVNNAAQTDVAQADVQFFAVQSRNNPNFLCSTGYKPTIPILPL